MFFLKCEVEGNWINVSDIQLLYLHSVKPTYITPYIRIYLHLFQSLSRSHDPLLLNICAVSSLFSQHNRRYNCTCLQDINMLPCIGLFAFFLDLWQVNSLMQNATCPPTHRHDSSTVPLSLRDNLGNTEPLCAKTSSERFTGFFLGLKLVLRCYKSILQCCKKHCCVVYQL